MKVAAVSPTVRPPHAEGAAKAGTDLTGGGKGKLFAETLDNGVRLIVAERPGANSVKVQVGTGAGSLEDPRGKLGLAHFFEHMKFEGTDKTTAARQEAIRSSMGNNWNAWTNRTQTVYYGVAPKAQARKAASLLTEMYTSPIEKDKFAQEKAAVKNEMLYNSGSLEGELWHINERLVHGDHPLTNNVIGTRKTVDAITMKDAEAFNTRYYVGRNTVALVEGDPKALPLDVVRKELGKLEPGARIDHSGMKRPFVPGRALQVVPDRTTGTVQLSVSLPIPGKLDKLPVPAELVTSALGKELNDKLRRNHHLTYGVGVNLGASDAAEGQVLTLETQVAPAKARAALADMIETLRDAQDGFGPKTFSQHKQQFVARIRAEEKDTTELDASMLAEMAFQQALEQPGVEIPDPEALQGAGPSAKERLEKLRNARPADFAKAAAKMLDLSNIKILAHGDVGKGEELLRGLRDAKIDPRTVKKNPVDLSLYKDMGLG